MYIFCRKEPTITQQSTLDPVYFWSCLLLIQPTLDPVDSWSYLLLMWLTLDPGYFWTMLLLIPFTIDKFALDPVQIHCVKWVFKQNCREDPFFWTTWYLSLRRDGTWAPICSCVCMCMGHRISITVRAWYRWLSTLARE